MSQSVMEILERCFLISGCANVGGLPVPCQRRAPQDPHRDDDDHLQEDLRQPRHSVEVSLDLSVPGPLIKKYNIMYNSLCLRLKDT